MTAALTPRCHVCGSRLGPLEPAVVRTYRAEVCDAWLLTPEGRGFIEAWAEKLPAV